MDEIDILKAIGSKNILGKAFKDIGTWRGWMVLLAVVFALPLERLEAFGISEGEAFELYKKCTGRSKWPVVPFLEVFIIAGRRAGKSFIVAVQAVYRATMVDYKKHLALGERAVVAVISVDRHAAQIVFGYIKALLRLPIFKSLKIKILAERIEIGDHVAIEIFTSDFRRVRGATLACCIVDELAFLSCEGASPDYEIAISIRPALKTIPNATFWGSSTAYGQAGMLWTSYKESWGNDESDTLVWKAATETMNPSIDKVKIQRELERDPTSAQAEWLAEFRQDISTFISRSELESSIVSARVALPPQEGVSYLAFVDPSGGGEDEFTACVCHAEDAGGGPVVVIDKVVAARGNPKHATARISSELRAYGITKVFGDRYAGEWPKREFERLGIEYEASALDKSALYVQCLPYLTSGQVQLIDDETLIRQFTSLERRTGSSGKDSIDHPRIKHMHDDRANCVAGGIVHLLGEASKPTAWEAPYQSDDRWGQPSRIVDPMERPDQLDFYERSNRIMEAHRRGFVFGKREDE